MKQNKLIHLAQCPVCDSQEIKKLHDIKDYSTSKEVFSTNKCQACGFVFTNPIPSQDVLGMYYQSSDYISHTNDDKSIFGKVYQWLREINLATKSRWIASCIKRPAKLLDYGSGTGEFLNYMKKQGWQTQGVELADSVRQRSIDKYALQVIAPTGFDTLQSESYDAITMWHVLEHVPDLQKTFSEIVSKLKKGGYLFVAVPNRASYDAQHYGAFWAAWDMPIHFYHFTKNDMANLAAKNGLQNISTKNMLLDAFYVSLLSEQYKTGKKNWLRAAFIGLKSNYLAKSDNASSLTYIFRKL